MVNFLGVEHVGAEFKPEQDFVEGVVDDLGFKPEHYYSVTENAPELLNKDVPNEDCFFIRVGRTYYLIREAATTPTPSYHVENNFMVNWK